MGTIITDKEELRIVFGADNMYEYRQMFDRIKRTNEIISNCENNPKLKPSPSDNNDLIKDFPARCPKCNHQMPHSNRICTKCGYDDRKNPIIKS